MSDLPSGTLTFLFTDVEGSSARWERHPTAMRDALRRHDAIMRGTLEAHHGNVYEAAGDAFHAVFERAEDAVAAADAIRTALNGEDWSEVDGLPVRIALHAGSATMMNAGYAGAPIDAIKQLVAVCQGGQTTVSQMVSMLLGGALPNGLSLTPLGFLRLDADRPTDIFQLDVRGVERHFPAFRDPRQPATNLPRQLTSFLGRTTELAEMRDILARSRVLTICGPGGVGKTRTALALANDVLFEWADGVWFTSFAAIEDSRMLGDAIVASLGVGERHTKTARETLVEHLAKRSILLILDNCEHVVEAASELVDYIERACPSVTVIATSREPLRSPGEYIYVLRPLAVALNDDDLPSLDMLDDSPAVALFLERAGSMSQSVRYGASERLAVAQLCVHLDGLPLAIELAAARSNIFLPSVLAELIDRRFRILPKLPTGGTSPHRTLHGLVGWSYDLLSEQEQTLFRRLAIFSGGWTIEAAETVTSGNGLDSRDVFGLLANLYDKSLIARPGGDGDRFAFLETIRAFALEILDESGELDAARRAHVEYFAMLTLHAEPYLRSSEQLQWVERLTADSDNLRVALDATERDPVLMAAGNVMCASLTRFWIVKGSLREGRVRLQRSLERDAIEPRYLVRSLCGAAIIAFNELRIADFVACASDADRVAFDLVDPWTAAYSACIYALALAYSCDSESGRNERDAAISKAHVQADAVADPWLLFHMDYTQRYCAINDGNKIFAAQCEERALSNAEKTGDRMLITSSAIFTAYRYRSEDPQRSLSLLARSSSLLLVGNYLALASSLECAVEITFDAEMFEMSARLMAAARSNRLRSGLQPFHLDPDKHRSDLLIALGTDPFCSSEREGTNWSFVDAVAALQNLPSLFDTNLVANPYGEGEGR